MDVRMQRFLDVSAQLTGFARFDLVGTGMAETYFHAVDAAEAEGGIDQLLAAWPSDVGAPPAAVLDDPTLGALARNLILLWYCGTWAAKPVSGAAFRAGLQWAAAGAHPPGAAAPGYASWAIAPDAGPA